MNEDLQNYLNEIRRDFSGKPLTKESVAFNPYIQFDIWFEEAVNAQILDPQAMTISTVEANGQPTSRIVYLRGITEDGFIFYTNYNSNKAKDIEVNNKVALNFLWRALDRQVRIDGVIEKVSEIQSDEYFSKRPRESQIGAWASNQSSELNSREELEQKVAEFTKQFEGQVVPRPPHWGGYIVKPFIIEFWQGRPNRLHDRILYEKQGERWNLKRLSP